MSKNKACLNPTCSNYKKEKYKTAERLCPYCGNQLEYICAQKGCFKVIPENPKEKFCPLCKAEIDDRNAKAWDVTKKVAGYVGTAFTFALSFVGAKNFSKKK